jgi:hypothetical protein
MLVVAGADPTAARGTVVVCDQALVETAKIPAHVKISRLFISHSRITMNCFR